MYAVFGALSIVGFIIFLVGTIVSLFTKKGLKRNLIALLACFVVFDICIALTPSGEEKTEQEAGAVSNEAQDEIQNNSPDNPDDEKAVSQTVQGEPARDSSQEGESLIAPSVPVELTDAQKEEILKTDSAIWERILSAEENYGKLLTAMESVNSLYSLYSFCEDLEALMNQYSSDVINLSDERAGEYVQCAGIYFIQIKTIAKHVQKYANSGNMKELSKAEDGMQSLNTTISGIVAARFAYLSACGFSDEEIIALGEENAG